MSVRLSTTDILIIIGYLAVVIGLGLAMKARAAKNIGNYFLGGRTLPWWALAMSGSSSYFDITGTMWIVSLFVIIGLQGMWVQWIWGFVIPVFYMVYMGKWIRRSGVMTGSEWMETRFGSGKAGEIARGSYTFYAVLTITAFLAYGATGMGKFGSVYLHFANDPIVNQHICSALIIGVTGLYVIAGGFHGVVMVEIFQTIVLSLGALLIAYLGFTHVDPAALAAKVPHSWGSLIPKWNASYPAFGPDYSIFGAMLVICVVKGLMLSLSGPEQLYDFQRFLAAKNPKEASKMGALWGVLHTIRWPMAMALATLGIAGMAKVGDPEKVLPSVIQSMLPIGVRGFAIAALLSGFLATFNSTVNGGASYVVKDIYHKYLNPKASQKTLIRASYVSSALLIVMGVGIGMFATSIGQMFTWIMGTLGAGVLLPNVLRWYWWRVNGWGYASGTIAGMLLSLVQAFTPRLLVIPLYQTFPVIAGSVLVITVIVTLLTKPTEQATLVDFYTKVRPGGFWGPVAKEAALADAPAGPKSTTRRDAFNVVIGIPWIISMYLCPVYLILHRFTEAGITAAIVAVASVILYQTWYKTLSED